MSANPTASELDSFQAKLVELLGLRFEDNRLSFLAEVLARRVQERRTSTAAYLEQLGSDALSGELSALARELTVGETYFFRHSDQFRAFEEVALPERLSARARSRKLRLLSAGCASGEEAYSLVIALRERCIEPAYEVEVYGIDVNPDALAKAQRAVYSVWSLRETPAELRERWFERDGRDYRLARTVRDAVRFEQHNLCGPQPLPFAAASFDVIFFRNVLMYFTQQQAARAVERLARLLAPGGFLFLGHAETMRGLSHDFHLRHTHDTFYYQLKSGTEQPESQPELLPPIQPGGEAREPSPATEWVDDWLQAVERSSERIRELSNPQAPIAPGKGNPPKPSSERDLSQPLELLRHDRFTEALELLQRPSQTSPDDPAALLLRAALLAQQGAFGEAQHACHDVLRLDDLNAGAHYLLALCCERRGDSERAVEHDRTAIYLDAGFAMPHLHLGLMARRRRDTASARDELGQALLLLEREDESRLLLFGGGFSRAALLALCRSELSNLKGRS